MAKETVGEAAFEIGADAVGEVVGIGVALLLPVLRERLAVPFSVVLHRMRCFQ